MATKVFVCDLSNKTHWAGAC